MSIEIKISTSAIMKNYNIGSGMTPGCPRLKCQLPAPQHLGSRVSLLLMEIKISKSAIMKNHKIGSCMVSGGPRA